MKLHLPVALLVALVSAAGYSYAETTPTEISVGDGTYSYTTSADGTLEATFTGDGTNGFIGGGYGYKNRASSSPEPGNIGAVAPGYKASDSSPVGVAASTELTIGGVDDNGEAIETKLNRVVTGVRGYAVTGDKTITVKEGATVGIVIGGYDMSTVYGVGGDANAEWTSGYFGTKFAPKSDSSATITINVEGGNVTQILASYTAGNLMANEMAAAQKYFKDDPDGLKAYLENPAWAQNEKIDINIKGGNTTLVYGGGFNGAVNNTVEISVEGEGTTVGDIFGGTCGKNGFEGYVQETSVEIKGGTVTGNVCGGGVNSDSYVKEDTHVVLSGGEVEGSVYGAGDGDTVKGDTKVTITGEGTQVGGVISGGGANDATVEGDRILEVAADHDSTGKEQGYKLADFTDVNVEGKILVDDLTAAEEGTDVKVGSTGAIVTNAGALTGLNSLEVEGTLTVDVTNGSQGEAAVSGTSLTLGDSATINIIDNSGSTDEISLFGFDNVEGGEELTLTMNGQSVSNDMWDFSNGGIVIKELSAATLSLSANQGSFYRALQAMNAAGVTDAGLAALATCRDSAAVRAQIDMLSGHEYATAMTSQVEGNLGHMRRLRAAMGAGPALDSYTTFALCGAAADGPAYTAPVEEGKRWRAGVQVYHEEGELDADASGNGYERSETGAMLTAEYYMNKAVTLGAALSCGRTSLEPDHGRKRYEDNTRLDFYAMYGKNRWRFATALGFGLHEHEMKRTLTSAEADGYSVNFLQDVAYTLLSREKDSVQAFATLASSWNKLDGFTEKGAYALRVHSQDAWTTDVTVGARYNHLLPALGAAPAGLFTAQAGVTATLGDVDSQAEMSLNGFRYSQEGATRDRWGWTIGVGVDVPVRSNVSVFGTVDTVVRGDYSSIDGQVGVKMAF
ncbi:MAG: autotransporter domain-containing protein [Akkermansia sp.]|nr:autotransporter domain-containing protein [Akkermansia sp.]